MTQCWGGGGSGTTAAHTYAGGTQQELTSAGTNQFIYGRSNQYGQPWVQSFNTGGGSQVFVERDATGTPLGLHSAGHDYYLALDNLGSVIAGIDTSGNVAAHYAYDPYGNTVTADESGLGAPNIIRYTGGAVDLTTGLIKLGQRYYNPATGTFTQQDANQILANPSNGNLYAYAGDNPINYADPSGACFFWCAISAGVIFEALFAATCGAFLTGITAGAGAPLAEVGCFYAGGVAAGWVGYEAGK